MKKLKFMILSFLIMIISMFGVSPKVYALNNDSKQDMYPNINYYLTDLFNSNIYDVHLVDDNGNDLTKNFLIENKNNNSDVILENYLSYNCWLEVRNYQTEDLSTVVETRATQTITKTTPYRYRVLTINGRKTANELGVSVRATCAYNDNTGQYISFRDPYLYDTSATSGTCKLKFTTEISSTRRKVVHKNFKITVTDMIGGNNSGMNVTYDTVTLSDQLVFN